MKLKSLTKARYDRTAAVTVTGEAPVDELKNSALHSSTYQFPWKSYLLILLFPQSNHSLSLSMNETCDHSHFAFCRRTPNPHTSFHRIMPGDGDFNSPQGEFPVLSHYSALASFQQCLPPRGLALHPA